VTNHKVSRTKSEVLLLGRIFDDRGHRMTPSPARRRALSTATTSRRPSCRADLNKLEPSIGSRPGR
jgi:hypothetical protein